jgi:hypothetical protein
LHFWERLDAPTLLQGIVDALAPQGRCGEAPIPELTLGVAAVGAAVDVAGDGVIWGVQTTRSSKT